MPGAVRVGAVLLGVFAAAGAAAEPPAATRLAIQGMVRDQYELPLPAGDVVVRVFADSTGGVPVYDSGAEFAGAIEQGILDITVGQGSPLLLDPEASAFLEFEVEGVEFIGDAAGGRWRLEPGGGSSGRPDLEARLDALEAAMGLAAAAPHAARIPAPPSSAPPVNTLAFSSVHPFLGLARLEGSGPGHAATSTLMTQPVGRWSRGDLRLELGPYWLIAPTPAPAIRFVRDVPGDQGRSVRIRWRNDLRERPYVAADPLPRITSYTLYRRVDAGQAKPARDEMALEPALALPPGTWDVLTTIPATLDTTYQTVVPTLCDSATAGVCWSVFVVRAITDRPGTYHDSGADSGWSVDNLAPGVPQGLTVLPGAEGTALEWLESGAPDFQYFRVYRSTDPDFIPGPATFVHATASTGWTDPAAGAFTYRLTAVDVNGNESPPASVTVTTGVEAAVPGRLDFVSLAPNPFQRTLTFVIEVPAQAGAVELAVYDLAGRRVRAIHRGALPAGRHVFAWDGRSDGGRRLGAGVYMTRLTGAGRTLVRRATLVR